MRSISNKTKLNGIIGYPLDHSQSPLLHRAIYKALNIDAVFLAFPHQNIQSIVDAIKTFSIELTAVTMPFKKKIIPFLDDMSDEGQQLQAVNTLIYRDNKLWGHNTDIDGIAYAFRLVDVYRKNILLLGAGGAAAACAFYFKKKSANIWVFNRTTKNAFHLAEKFNAKIISFKEMHTFHFDIIVNATPIGMYPNSLNSPLPHYKFHKDQIVFDMVYNPKETEILKQAKSNGATCISGFDMFLGQGLRQIECWLNQPISLSKLNIMEYFNE